MNFKSRCLLAVLAFAASAASQAQVPVAPAADHAALLTSADPTLAANKRLVYDFWREVFDMFRIENDKIAEHWDPALRQ